MLLERIINNGVKLYHKEIGFPDSLEMPNGFSPVVKLRYSNHATAEALFDRYGKITLPASVDVRKGDTFEVEATNNVVSKMAVRFPYDATRDIIIVLHPVDGFVRTVWFNLKTDKHKTLDRSKYSVA